MADVGAPQVEKARLFVLPGLRMVRPRRPEPRRRAKREDFRKMMMVKASPTELKKSECVKVISHLAEVDAQPVTKAVKVMLPGLGMVKTRLPP